ncbi:MAG: TonB-dependent receptor, partial [Acidobacteriota bacterium]|nr:TonB-dependent receptor [Acidobacteriota bacterium]
MITASRRLFAPAILLILLLRPTDVPAQSTSAIQGTITDASGSVIPNAKVIARNIGTSEERNAVTDTSGSFAIPALTPGTYRIQAQAAGMQTVAIENLTLEVGQTSVQNLTMGVANTSEVVQITAQSPVLENTTMTVGEVVNYRTVQEIPLNGRHFVDLGVLIPGSVTPPANGFLTAPLRGQGGSSFNTAGNREDTVNFMINGINLNDMTNGQITFQPSIGTVQEFKVDNSTYSAEYGRNSGAIVNIATRSGTNEFHGEAFEFVRNDYFDARNYFNRKGVQQSPFKRNQFGGDGGGPILKNKTFFFLSYEALRQRQGLTINQTVLSDAQRAQAATVGNPTVLKLLPLLPQPNSPGNKFVGSATAPVNIDQGTANISHEFSANDRLNGYFVLQHDLRQEPTLQGNNVSGFGDTRESRRQIFTLNETHVFSPNVVNEARLGYNRIHIVFTPNAQLNPVDFGINDSVTTAIGLPQISLRDIGLNFGGPSGFPQGRGVYTAVLSNTLTYLRGKHSFKFGGEFRRYNGNNFGGDTGSFTFDTVDAFLRGQASVFTVTPGFNPSRIFVNALGFFAQDSYKVRPNLTLEFGLRYEWNGTPTEAQNRFVVFDPIADSLIRVGSGLDRVFKQNARNLEPRVGFAWDVWKKGRTVIRGGYGLLTDQPIANLVTGLSTNPPFSTPLSLTNVTFATAFTGTGATNAISPNSINRDFKDPYVQSWNLNVQQQITGSLGLMAGYFGSKGTHLRVIRNLNQP